MTKSKGKRGRPTLEELLERQWCYYCNKDFDDLRILIDHQKAKHYKCQVAHCNRRLNTVGGLRVHMQQVHKEELKNVPNAMDDRDDINLEIFGMHGIPPQIRQAWEQSVTQEFYKQEAEHRARTGNNPNSAGGEPAAKKLKLDDEARAELKKRAAEAKAKREAQKAAAAAGLPMPAENESPAAQSTPVPPADAVAPAPGVEQLPPVAALPANPSLPAAPIPPYQNGVPPVYAGYAQPAPVPGYAQPLALASGYPPVPGFAPVPGYPPAPGYAPAPGFPAPYQPIPQAASPPGWARPASLPQPPAFATPPAYPAYPAQPGSNGLPHNPHLPAAYAPPPAVHSLPPGLPARPTPAAHNSAPAYTAPPFDLNKLMDEQSKIALDRLNGKDSSVDQAPSQEAASQAKTDTPEKAAEKPSKAAKKKQPTRLVLSDNEVSWEERRATLTKYQKAIAA